MKNRKGSWKKRMALLIQADRSWTT